MSAARLHDSIHHLLATADALETGVAVRERVLPAAVSGPAIPQRAPRGASTTRVVMFALAYPAACIALLTASLAIGDAALPRPDAPHLVGPVAGATGAEDDLAIIRPVHANRP